MELKQEDIQKIADLAHLEISDEENKQYQKELSEVLNYMETLNEVEVEGIEPTAQVSQQTNVFREDRAKDWNKEEKENTLKQSSKYKEGKINIDKIISK